MTVAKPIALQQLATQIFVMLKGFAEHRFTGDVQFVITMNQGGFSRAVYGTQAVFGYDRALADQQPEFTPPPPPQPPPRKQEGGAPPAHKAPPINLIATMSRKE